MKRFARVFAVMLGVAVLGFIVSLVPQKKASAQDAGPTVTIGSPIPLPVKGNVSITNTSAIPVSFSGTAQPISFSNQSTAPLFTRDVEQAARSPFRTQCSIVVSGQTTACILTTVPSDKVLVVQDFSVDATLDFGSRLIRLFLVTAAKGVNIETYFPTFFEGTDTTFGPGNALDHYAGGREVSLYSDPGSVVSCFAESGRTNATLGVNCSISGFLVPAQLP